MHSHYIKNLIYVSSQFNAWILSKMDYNLELRIRAWSHGKKERSNKTGIKTVLYIPSQFYLCLNFYFIYILFKLNLKHSLNTSKIYNCTKSKVSYNIAK